MSMPVAISKIVATKRHCVTSFLKPLAETYSMADEDKGVARGGPGVPVTPPPPFVGLF